MIRYLYWLYLIMWIAYFPQSKAYSNENPHFGDNILLLALPNQILRQPMLSPDGIMVFANADLYAFDELGHFVSSKILSSQQATWNINSTDLNDGLIEIDSHQIMKLNNDFKAASAFSPDGQFLAVKTDNEVKIQTLPKLSTSASNPISSMPNNEVFYRQIAWSQDSKLLGLLVDGGILVWDIEPNLVYRYPLDYGAASIKSVETGWFIQILDRADFIDRDDPSVFAICTFQLETCESYQYPKNILSIIAPNGQTVLTSRAVEEDGVTIDTIFGIWKRQESGAYQLQQEASEDEKPFNIEAGFSPDSRYIFSNCFSTSTIWDAETLTPIQSFPEVFLIWLPDNRYFLSIDHRPPSTEIYLYKLGEDRPIDELDIATLSGYTDYRNIIGWQVGSAITPDELASVSDDGRKVLINLGLSAVIIPIEYE